MSQPLNIEVLGIGFPNKGAELMLVAIAEWASRLQMPARLAVSWDTHFRERARYGLLGRISYPVGTRIPYDRLVNLVPKRLVERLGAVRDRDVDLVLDASGYAYGDPWGAGKAEQRLGGRIAEWRKQGKRIVLLPQAFGPFTEPGLVEQMQTIGAHAHRLYARDAASLGALRGAGVQGESIATAPDFTCLVDGRDFVGMDQCDGAVGLIPNHKVYAMGRSIQRDDYVAFFGDVAKRLHQAGRKVVLILHEGIEDAKLCSNIQMHCGEDLPLVAPEHPKEIKRAIGRCAAVLTSRFHGFASALFQGVPALATSWSHKYEQLAMDFGQADLVLSALEPAVVSDRLQYLSGECSGLRSALIERSAATKVRATAMWQEIEKLIGK